MSILDQLNLFWELTFEEFLLGTIRFVMARTRYLEREAHSLEILPAALRRNRASKLLTHPESNFGTAPQASIWECLFKHLQ